MVVLRPAGEEGQRSRMNNDKPGVLWRNRMEKLTHLARSSASRTHLGSQVDALATLPQTFPQGSQVRGSRNAVIRYLQKDAWHPSGFAITSVQPYQA